MNGFILAGGKSSRMGQDKGLMQLGNKLLVEYSIQLLQNVTNQIFIITSNLDYQQFGFPIISDIEPNIGPAGGILTALYYSISAQNIILGCDMPFLSLPLLEQLISEKQNASICIFKNETFIEPLFGIYDTDILQEWKSLLKNKNYKLEFLLSQFNTKYIQFSSSGNLDPFVNINSKNDFEKQLQNLKNGKHHS